MNFMFSAIKILSIVTLSIFLFSCGSTEQNNDIGKVQLSTFVAGDTINILAGDKLSPVGDDIEIDVTHVIETDKKSASVISGKVTLSRIITN